MKYSDLHQLAGQRDLVLGSSSPRRARLLTELGLEFRKVVPRITEAVLPDEKPCACALRLAEEKAIAVSLQLEDREIVLGGDTIVVLDEAILGKPRDQEDAFRTLSLLAGQKHYVCTALALADHEGLICSGTEQTEVVFNKVGPEQIREYIASGEPMDKAGAYGIQGMGAFLVDSIEGNLDNVIGLPRTLLNRLAGGVLH
ncbi:MAG: septum formation protein Maf [bacterium]|nr:septum formation protein Maf [bacterium]